MKRSLFISPLLGVLLMLILYGCRTEESTIERTNNLEQAKALFEKGNYQFPVLKYTNEIDWNNPIYSQGNGYETVEIPLVLNKGINIGGSVNAKNRLLFRKTRKDKSWDVYYLFIMPETTKENIIDNVSFQSVSNDFKGKVIVLNSDNKIVDHLVFSNDIQIQKSASTKLNTIAYAKPDVKCYNYGILYDDGTFEALYFLGCYGGADGGYNGSGYGGSHGGGSGGGGSAPSESAVKDQIKDQPFALVDAPCDVVKKWLATAKHTVAPAQINKLKSIVETAYNNSSVTPGGMTYERIASVQKIDDAYSAVVNMDYFPVTVNQLPIVNGTRLTPRAIS
ncbi:hypothetical protein [Elizabethkingia anophelis]|nr:hypothetical protein [Elizabethkingia anophelis]MYY48281.1 hypothetical protein [Elizabethkingia anophelis]